MIEQLTLVGAGGHAAVVLDALLLSHPTCNVQLVDDDPEKNGKSLLRIKIRAPFHLNDLSATHFHLAIGDNRSRARLYRELSTIHKKPFSILCPTAAVAPSATYGGACFMAAQSVVAPGASLGRAVIVNHGAIVDHDCDIGDWTHICPNATLSGGVVLGEGVFLGAGATVLPGCRIVDWAIVGAGAVVHQDVRERTTVVGVPARECVKK